MTINTPSDVMLCQFIYLIRPHQRKRYYFPCNTHKILCQSINSSRFERGSKVSS